MTIGAAVGVVSIPPSWDCSYVPSEEPLYAILERVVQHGVENPTHGTNCACMDAYIWEVRRHISRAVPPDRGEQEDIHSRMDDRWRISWVLKIATRDL